MRQIADLAELQAQLLARAADWLTPGGRIVYATCSLEQAEGEDQIARFLDARPDFARDPIATSELPEGMAPDPQGWLRTLPDTLASAGGTDGFFIARLVRRAH